MKSGIVQVLRSKGFVWLAGNDIMAGEWSQAGSIMRIGCGGPWFAALPRKAWNIVKVCDLRVLTPELYGTFAHGLASRRAGAH